MERDVNNVPKQQNEEGPQPGTSSSSSSSAIERNFSKHNQNASDNRQHLSDHNSEQPNRDSKTSVPKTTCGDMDSNPQSDRRKSCEACSTPGFIIEYCGVDLCDVCVAFVTHMVKKKFIVRCKQNDKCKIAPNSNGKVRCKACKLKSMTRLNIQHPDWEHYMKSLTVTKSKPSDNSISISSATSRPTPSVTSQPLFNDLQPTRLSSEHKPPQPSTSNAGVKVKEASKSEANTSESAQGRGQAAICRACKRARDSDDSTLCLDCVNFVIEVKSLSDQYVCNKKNNCDTSHRDHLLSCTFCRLESILNVKAEMPAQVDQKGPRPIQERRQSNPTHQTSNHHDHAPRRQANPISMNAPNAPTNNSSNAAQVCQGCTNPNYVSKSYNLYLCSNCSKFIRQNSARPKLFYRRCPHGGRCNTRYKKGVKMCASCRTRSLRKLDIQDPAWIKYKMKMGLIGKSGPSAISTQARESSTPVVNPSGTSKIQARVKQQHMAGVKKCRVCSNTNQVTRYGGPLLCKNCVCFIKYTMPRVSEPVKCRHEGKCNTRYKVGSFPCRSCRLKKLFSFKINKGAWKRFKRMYVSQLRSAAPDGLEKASVDRPPQASDKSQYEPQQSISSQAQPQPTLPLVAAPTRADVENDEANATSNPDEEIISVVDNDPTACVACGGPSYLPTTKYGLHLCMGCVTFIERMPKFNFEVKCKKQGKCRTTFVPDHRIKCSKCRLKALLKLDIRHPAWIQYKESANSEKCDAIDDSYGVVCGICGHRRFVSRRSEEFICCQNCWTFLQYSEVRKFQDACKTGQYDCKLEHATLMCRGCRLRRAINIGFWDPKLKDSLHKDLLSPSECSEDDSMAPTGEHVSEESVEQTYSWCTDCSTQYPSGRLNTSAEQDSGVCQSPILQDVSAPVDRICPTCQAKRAASLGLRVRSPSKATETITVSNSASKSPTKVSKANRSQHCVICNNTDHVAQYIAMSNRPVCDNCKMFLYKTTRKPKFPPDCVTGKFNCQLEHVSASERSKNKRMCSGCRAIKAISLGFKLPESSKSASCLKGQPSSAINHSQQQVDTGATRRELASSVSVISSASALGSGPERVERSQPTRQSAPKLLCAFCQRHRIGRKKKDGLDSCLGCDVHLQTCETKPFTLFKCKTAAPNCENRGSQTQAKKVCFRCLAMKATSLGHKWIRPQEIAEMLENPVKSTNVKQSSSKDDECDICPSKRKVRESEFGFRHCRKCRSFLAKIKEDTSYNEYKCIREGRFNCRVENPNGFCTCAGCRLKRAIDLGFESPITQAWLKLNNLSRRPEEADLSAPSPVAVDTETTTTAQQDSPMAVDVPSPIGSLFVEDDDDDYTHIALDKQLSFATPDDDDTIDVEFLEDHQNTLHPSETRDRLFRRWFSCEVELPSPSPEPTKTIEDEIYPTPEEQVIVFSNDIGAGHKLPLVTQDLHPTERLSVEELTVTKLYMSPSSSLRQTLDPGVSDTVAATAAAQPAPRKTKLKMTLTLKTLRTTVDRRPMLKKQRTPTGVHLRPHTPTKQPATKRSASPPLIAPDEDCDASDDDIDELPEYIIDSNN